MSVKYKEFALKLARTAGKMIKTDFHMGMSKEWKADNTPLTKTDLVINQLVIDSVKKTFPTHSVLAEEGNNLLDGSDYVWVCDPIDGTFPFSHGIPTCVFSLALVKKGEVILGVIYDPFMDRLFFAEKGKGVTLNSKKVRVSKANSLKNVIIGAGFSKKNLFNINEILLELKKQDVKLLNLLSITYMGMLVAGGELAATIFPHDVPHDTAALKVIVEEAGGKVTSILGKEQRYDKNINGHLISNGLLHNKLLKIIKDKNNL